MKRRDFFTPLGGAAAWPVAARAQRDGGVRRVGMLIGGEENDPRAQRFTTAFREELAKFGWIDGRSLRTDLHYVGGHLDRLHVPAMEIVGQRPDAIFVGTGSAPTR